MAELAADTLVDGRYRVVSRLGSGGMAEVYCATDVQLGRRVALKLLHPRFAEDADFVERFRREASSAAGLSHQNIVSVYDRGEWDGTYYIAMEYVEGRSLKTLVTEEGAMEAIGAIDLVLQILRAARFAHQHGIIHRDLKPQNAIVANDGLVKVTDFGIARAGASDMTETGSIMGTAQYLSPEQAQGQAVGATSDLYSVGIILYELLAGHVPFDGPSTVTIALKQVTEAPMPPSHSNATVSPELDAVVLRAMAKDPAQRFPDAGAFIAALEQARDAQLAAAGGSTAQWGAVPADHTAVEPVPVAGAYDPYEPLEAEPHRLLWPWLLAAALLIAIVIAALTLGGSPARSPVPNVVGQPAASATATLRRASFHVVARTLASATVARGTVVFTSPRPGTRATNGSTVTLGVSGGPGTVTIPNVVSLGRYGAARVLRRAGLQVAEQLQASDQQPRDHVLATDPPPLSPAQAGSTVTLTVSSGRSRVTVPGVVGQTYDQATGALSGAGLTVARVDRAASQQAGTVLRQDPAAGVLLSKGSTVTLTVAKTSDQVTVPAVTGMNATDALSAVTAAGLTPTTVTQPVSNPARDTKVISQRPPGNRPVRRGSTVTLTVGRLQTTSTTTTTTTTATTPGKPGASVAPPSGASHG